ncbi:MAG: nickel-responsive transcriptional regulator NikR [Candidatus Hodarchaeales archaeon]|jgi:CopG family nickel-responsive transcriptional regulator
MKKTKRIKKPVTISLNPVLMEKLETYKEHWGYTNRSKIIEDALKDYFTIEDDTSEKVFAIISTFFNHHDRDVVSSLLSVQHHADKITVMYSSHLHLSHDFCLEIIVVEGEGKRVIKELEQKIKAIEGINFVKTTILPPLSLVI